jgi:hypothetical protein
MDGVAGSLMTRRESGKSDAKGLCEMSVEIIADGAAAVVRLGPGERIGPEVHDREERFVVLCGIVERYTFSDKFSSVGHLCGANAVERVYAGVEHKLVGGPDGAVLLAWWAPS